MAGKVDYSTTVPLRLRASEDMFWGVDFKNASFIASWVTPHDDRVERILHTAKEYTTDHRLPGYEEWKNTQQQEKSTYAQARAIYKATQKRGVSYVKSSLTFGNNGGWSEWVRMPREQSTRPIA